MIREQQVYKQDLCLPLKDNTSFIFYFSIVWKITKTKLYLFI